MSVYGPSRVSISIGSTTEISPQLVEDMLFQKCLFRGPDYAQIKEVYYKYELNSCGFGYFYFENRSKSQIYMIVVQMTEPLVNCKFSNINANISGLL